jgi:hypothetical protein
LEEALEPVMKQQPEEEMVDPEEEPEVIIALLLENL